MWLLPVLSGLSRLSARTFYRLSVTGGAVPSEGPAILVANHPNSLVDPVLLAAAAGRPVRFLAKAPLFDHPAVGFLVRGSGAIPVYRRVDDPGAMGRNEDMFRAAHDALAEGDAVGLFPEGVSHSEPSLMPLKTGAARLALGAAASGLASIPIIPVGIVLRRRETFRSPALVVVGQPVRWDDLTDGGPEDRDAVQRLTERIEAGLEAVTLNLVRWEDEPVVATAEAVWAAQAGAGGDDSVQVARVRRVAKLLAALRAEGTADWGSLSQRLADHRRRLNALDLTPATLVQDIGPGQVVRWSLTRVPLLVAASVAVAGSIVFWPPYRAVGWAVDRQDLATDVRATHKLLLGAALMTGWVIVLAVVSGLVWGWVAVLVALVGLPLLGLATLEFREWALDSWRAARRYLLMRSRVEVREELRAQQRQLADELEAINRRWSDSE
jgi:1-acyl-sn-glycerol-3-phosphate acyltransferase